jgi:hypothetical protein
MAPTGRQIIAAIIVVAALVFVFQNAKTGHFHFLWFDFRAPVWLCVCCYAQGFRISIQRDAARVSDSVPFGELIFCRGRREGFLVWCGSAGAAAAVAGSGPCDGNLVGHATVWP